MLKGDGRLELEQPFDQISRCQANCSPCAGTGRVPAGIAAVHWINRVTPTRAGVLSAPGMRRLFYSTSYDDRPWRVRFEQFTDSATIPSWSRVPRYCILCALQHRHRPHSRPVDFQVIFNLKLKTRNFVLCVCVEVEGKGNAPLCKKRERQERRDGRDVGGHVQPECRNAASESRLPAI